MAIVIYYPERENRNTGRGFIVNNRYIFLYPGFNDIPNNNYQYFIQNSVVQQLVTSTAIVLPLIPPSPVFEPLTLSDSSGNSGSSVNINDVGLDVIILAGQSNVVGLGDSLVSQLDYTNPRILQFPTTGTFKNIPILASHPIIHQNTAASTKIGFGLIFAQNYLNIIPINRNVLLVPVANNSTGFLQGNWNPGNPQYNVAVQQANAALSIPNARLKAILWLQGETDMVDNMTASAYRTAQDSMITSMRSAITGAANVPFIVGDTVQPWIFANNYTPIANVIRETPSRLPNTGVVSSNGLVANSTSDAVHFNAAAQRILGRRYFDKYLEMIRGVPQSSLPALVDDGGTPPVPPTPTQLFLINGVGGTSEDRLTPPKTVTQNGSSFTFGTVAGRTAITTTTKGDHLSVATALPLNYTAIARINVSSNTVPHGIFGNADLYFAVSSSVSATGNPAYTLKVGRPGTYELAATTVIAASTWYHAAISYDNTTRELKVYLNGVLEGTKTLTFAARTATPTPIIVGALTGVAADGLLGSFTDVSIYNSVLTDTEVLSIYNG